MGSTASKAAAETMSSPSYSRRAVHAGSWYSDNEDEMRSELQGYMSKAHTSCLSGPVRGLIVPHAGYRYSGPTAAYSYRVLQEALQRQPNVQTILVLHPSHHVALRNRCAVSGASCLETPLGELTVNDTVRQQIYKLPNATFDTMDAATDQDEHSGEMQYPYLALVAPSLTVLPIMCGHLDTHHETSYGQALAEIIARPEVVTVVSTDFCHWGRRFAYQPTANNAQVPIHEYIKQLDQEGIDLIEMQRPGAFADYLKRTRNTICGRHAIAVWLRALEANAQSAKVKIQTLAYAQSSAVTSMHDSSVSYVSAVAVQNDD
jgi:MEMO1 family protein